MKITLTKLKLVKSRSRETHCFSATICIDGVVLCDVDNEGCGGNDRYTPTTKSKVSHIDLHKEIALINTELGKEMIKGNGYEIANDLEIVVSELINVMSLEKTVKSLINRRICYTKPSGGIYELPAKVKPTPENFDKIVKCDWWEQTNTFLKDMTLEDATAVYRNG